MPDQSALLLKKFCAGVADQNLRWELKQQLRSVPGSTFLDIRATALRWAEECTPCEGVGTRSAVAEAAGSTLLQQMQDGFARLSEQLTKQQVTIDQHTVAIRELGEAGKPNEATVRTRRRQSASTARNRAITRGCVSNEFATLLPVGRQHNLFTSTHSNELGGGDDVHGLI